MLLKLVGVETRSEACACTQSFGLYLHGMCAYYVQPCTIMMVIEPFFNNGKALNNMNNINLLRQNDDEWHHQIIILVRH